MSATTIHVGDRVRCRPGTLKAARLTGLGTAGPILVSPYIPRWDMVHVVWDDGGEEPVIRGHLVKVKVKTPTA